MTLRAAAVAALVPTGVIPAQRNAPRVRRPQSLDVLDCALFLPSIWFTCALGISLQLIGPGFVVVPVGTCLLYAILARTKPPRLLSAYFLLSIVAGGLSIYRLFPTSWQAYFSEEAIIRQLVPLTGFVVVAWASKAYFRRRLRHGNAFFGAPIFLVLGLILAPLVMFLQGVTYPGQGPLASIPAFYGALVNNISIAMFFIAGPAFLASGWRCYAALAAVLLIAVVSHFLQFKILALVLIASILRVPSRVVLVGLMATLTSIYAVGMDYISQVKIISPDSGVRLAMLADALSSVVDTYGLGVGYGTEAVKRVFYFPGLPVFRFFPDPSLLTHEQMLQILSTGIHNSFGQSLLRTGVPGFVLMLSAFLAAFPARNLPRGVRDHATVMFAIMFIACFVNPALESPLQVVGIGFLYGYLVALRATARARALPERARVPRASGHELLARPGEIIQRG